MTKFCQYGFPELLVTSGILILHVLQNRLLNFPSIIVLQKDNFFDEAIHIGQFWKYKYQNYLHLRNNMNSFFDLQKFDSEKISKFSNNLFSTIFSKIISSFQSYFAQDVFSKNICVPNFIFFTLSVKNVRHPVYGVF